MRVVLGMLEFEDVGKVGADNFVCAVPVAFVVRDTQPPIRARVSGKC